MDVLNPNKEPKPGTCDFSAERRELATVLEGALPRTSNMERLLRYVCEKYFDGHTSEIKEYTIAVEAFGRPPEFDPMVDSIVRVEAHRLRSRLNRYYSGKGAKNAIKIALPPGGYVPQFIDRRASLDAPVSAVQDPLSSDPSALPSNKTGENAPSPVTLSDSSLKIHSPFNTRPMIVGVGLGIFLAIGVFFSLYRVVFNRNAAPESERRILISHSPPVSERGALRILAGAKASLILEDSQETWVSDRYFKGGEAEEIPPRVFNYTSTPSLYYARRRGDFSYDIPLQPGNYELRLYFADAFFGQDNLRGGGEASRLFDVKANGEYLLKKFDLIADIGGSNSADIKIFTDIHPSPDGFLHLSFISQRDVAFVNAIEVLPTPVGKILPIRIHAWPGEYNDPTGLRWMSDRYFRGGVHFPQDTIPQPDNDPGVFSRGRFGNFSYLIPVPESGRFTLRLRFCKPRAANFFETDKYPNNFNVQMNGTTLLENFSLPSKLASTGCLVKEFNNITPSAQGKLFLSFVPNHGYAFVNSLEIEQESLSHAK